MVDGGGAHLGRTFFLHVEGRVFEVITGSDSSSAKHMATGVNVTGRQGRP